MFSDKKFGLSDSLIQAAKQAMSSGPVPRNRDELEEANMKKAATTPKTAKEKSLAALATPKDKITHKDVMAGRGVVAKEEAEQMDVNVYSIKNTKTGQTYYTSKYPVTPTSTTLKKIRAAGGDHKFAMPHKDGKPVKEETEMFSADELAAIEAAAEKLNTTKE